LRLAVSLSTGTISRPIRTSAITSCASRFGRQPQNSDPLLRFPYRPLGTACTRTRARSLEEDIVSGDSLWVLCVELLAPSWPRVVIAHSYDEFSQLLVDVLDADHRVLVEDRRLRRAALRSASSTHRRLAVLPQAITWMTEIASWQLRPGRNPYEWGSNRASHSGSSAFRYRAWWTRSAITRIPSGRCFHWPSV
jgi:hypothetical protein